MNWNQIIYELVIFAIIFMFLQIIINKFISEKYKKDKNILNGIIAVMTGLIYKLIINKWKVIKL